MKVLFLLLLALLGAGAAWIAWSSHDPAPAVASGPAPRQLSRGAAADERLAVFQVTGMCCEGCTEKLYLAATAVAGVRAVAVDHVSGTASVLCVRGTEVEPIAAALSFDKYEARLAP